MSPATSEAAAQDAVERLVAALHDTYAWDSSRWSMGLPSPRFPELRRRAEQRRERDLSAWVDARRATVQGCADAVLALDPQWFQDQAAACSSAESLIRLSVGDPPAQPQYDAQGFTDAVARVERNLAQWQGAAADAFAEQVQRIRDFDAQQANLLVQLGMAMIGGRDSVLAARASFVAVCDDTVAALGEYREATEARTTRVAVYVTVGIVSALCTFGAGAAATSGTTLAGYVFSGAGAAAGAGQLINTGNSVALTAIPAASIDDAVAAFTDRQDQVVRALDDELADMARKLDGFDTEYGPGARLLEPLPASTDVHTATYTYDDLRSEDRAPTAALDARIREAATTTAAVPGPITQALDPTAQPAPTPPPPR